MAKVTSKYQVTVPRKIADQYHIRPGDEIDWVSAGDAIRVIPRSSSVAPSPASQVHVFDQATERHRQRKSRTAIKPTRNRGWNREDLYGRGRSR